MVQERKNPVLEVEGKYRFDKEKPGFSRKRGFGQVS
jgi:hypothetical protein